MNFETDPSVFLLSNICHHILKMWVNYSNNHELYQKTEEKSTCPTSTDKSKLQNSKQISPAILKTYIYIMAELTEIYFTYTLNLSLRGQVENPSSVQSSVSGGILMRDVAIVSKEQIWNNQHAPDLVHSRLIQISYQQVWHAYVLFMTNKVTYSLSMQPVITMCIVDIRGPHAWRC